MTEILRSYPPELSPNSLSFLLTSLIDYSLSHGIIVRPREPSENNYLASHAPVTLFPSLFPRNAWEQALKVQTIYNVLYARIANDVEWLAEIMAQLVNVDEFVRQLWALYTDVRREGIVQDLCLGMFRSDYMIHVDPFEPSSAAEIKQVEFNTISSSFGGLSTSVTKLHQHLLTIGAYGKDIPITITNLPNNPAAEKLAAGLAEAHKAYGSPDAAVLFLVQDPESNAFDQRRLEYHLLEDHKIQTCRMTLAEVAASAKLDDNRRLIVPNITAEQGAREISVAYFRAGYGPDDYPSRREWDARRLVELSRAIKCPTIITQLAGCKKIQQVLSNPGILERFIDGESATEIRKTFAKMYSLDSSNEGREAQHLAFSNPEAYVLKPQREGGGNNIYRSSIPGFLRSLPDESYYNAYILMELIQSPPLTNWIVRKGGVTTGGVIGELGVYGTILWDSKGNLLSNEEAGWLLRTKRKDVDEGGIAAGFGCIDSICLV